MKKTIILFTLGFCFVASAIPVCPAGYWVSSDGTECISPSGTAYVNYQDKWWNRVKESPGQKLIEDTASFSQFLIGIYQFFHFIGQSCQTHWGKQTVVPHERQVCDSDTQCYVCNNGRFWRVEN